MTQRTVNICFEDIAQLKKDVCDLIESWSQTVRAGDELTLRVIEPALGQKK